MHRLTLFSFYTATGARRLKPLAPKWVFCFYYRRKIKRPTWPKARDGLAFWSVNSQRLSQFISAFAGNSSLLSCVNVSLNSSLYLLALSPLIEPTVCPGTFHAPSHRRPRMHMLSSPKTNRLKARGCHEREHLGLIL